MRRQLLFAERSIVSLCPRNRCRLWTVTNFLKSLSGIPIVSPLNSLGVFPAKLGGYGGRQQRLKRVRGFRREKNHECRKSPEPD